MKRILFFLLLTSSTAVFANETSLRILSWNIKMLPRQFNSFIKHFPLQRSNIIPELLNNDSVDVICFQEAFDRRVNNKLIKALSAKFPYVIGPANERTGKLKLNSGIIFFSRFPMEKLGSIVFDDCGEENCMALKGGLLVEVTVKDKKIQILGTHMDASPDEKIKESQLKQLSGLLEKNTKNAVPQLICGDFNIEKTNKSLYQKMLSFLKADDGPLSGDLQYSFDPSKNDMNYENDTPKLIDFILLRSNGFKQKVTERKIRRYEKKWNKKQSDLSDHFAVLMEMEL